MTVNLVLNKTIFGLHYSPTAPAAPPSGEGNAIWWLIPPVTQGHFGNTNPANLNSYVWVPLTSTDIDVNSSGPSSNGQTYRIRFLPGRIMILDDVTGAGVINPNAVIPSSWVYLVAPAVANVDLEVASSYEFNVNPYSKPTAVTAGIAPVAAPVPSPLEVIPNKIVWHIHATANDLTAAMNSVNNLALRSPMKC